MACELFSVGVDTECKENFSGVGNYFLIASKAALANCTPEYDESEAKFTDDSFKGAGDNAAVKVVKVKIVADTGQVTSQSNPNAGGFNNVFTCRVGKDMKKMSSLSRRLNNQDDYYVLVPTGTANEYYVVGDPNRAMQYQDEFDSGNTPDSDHGHTLTFTVNAALYPAATWTGVVEVVATEETGTDPGDGKTGDGN